MDIAVELSNGEWKNYSVEGIDINNTDQIAAYVISRLLDEGISTHKITQIIVN